MATRSYDWESRRRSLAMANPDSWALKREEAMALLAHLQEMEGQLRGLREGIAQLLDATAPHRQPPSAMAVGSSPHDHP